MQDMVHVYVQDVFRRTIVGHRNRLFFANHLSNFLLLVDRQRRHRNWLHNSIYRVGGLLLRNIDDHRNRLFQETSHLGIQSHTASSQPYQ
jgi:hypothetical protein